MVDVEKGLVVGTALAHELALKPASVDMLGALRKELMVLLECVEYAREELSKEAVAVT